MPMYIVHYTCIILQIVLALGDVGLTEVDVEFIKYFINIFMYYTADVMKVIF